jgi:hypothetical protein
MRATLPEVCFEGRSGLTFKRELRSASDPLRTFGDRSTADTAARARSPFLHSDANADVIYSMSYLNLKLRAKG